MSVYTYTNFTLNLKPDAPNPIKVMLYALLVGTAEHYFAEVQQPGHPLFDHPFFRHERALSIFCKSIDSPFDGRVSREFVGHDDYSVPVSLNLDCQMNHEAGELGIFIDWIFTYLDLTKENVVWSRNENRDFFSALFCVNYGRLVWILHFSKFGDPRFVDLSIMPAIQAPKVES